MLRKATEEDLSALVALRCKAAGTNRADAAGWLQNVAGLENILVLEKNGQPPAAMLAAVPVEYGQHHGIWLCGAAGAQGVPLDRLLPKLIESCLRAYGASGFDFAVMTSDGTQNAETLKALGFAGQLPLRLLQMPIRRDLLAQAGEALGGGILQSLAAMLLQDGDRGLHHLLHGEQLRGGHAAGKGYDVGLRGEL